MKHSNSRKTERGGALTALLFATVVGGVLRAIQLQLAFDESGLPQRGHPVSYALAFFCAAITVLIALYAYRLPKRTGWRKTYLGGTALTFVSMLAACLLVAASVLSAVQGFLQLHEASSQMDAALRILMNFFGVFAGLCLLLAASARQKGSAPASAAYIVPFLYVMIRLVMDFRSWSSDPIILDYSFKLFACICSMGGAYRIGGYCFNKGCRRLGAFWAMTGVFFCGVAIPGADALEELLYLALALWMLSCSCMLLGIGKRTAPPERKTAPEQPAAPEQPLTPAPAAQPEQENAPAQEPAQVEAPSQEAQPVQTETPAQEAQPQQEASDPQPPQEA